MWTLLDSDDELDTPRVPAVPGIVAFARSRLGFQPDPRQEKLLASGVTRGMVNCTRQWGKSTMAAVMAIHRAYFVPKSLIVVVCPAEKQSAELVRKVRGFAASLGIRRRTDGANRVSLEFPNGSRIIGLPANEATLRGLSAVSMMILDEASRIPDVVYKALRPMLAVSEGELWLLSTPYGRLGFFYENWVGGGEEWTRFSVPATECPSDLPEVSARRDAAIGGCVVPAGVSVRVHRRRAPDVWAG